MLVNSLKPNTQQRQSRPNKKAAGFGVNSMTWERASNKALKGVLNAVDAEDMRKAKMHKRRLDLFNERSRTQRIREIVISPNDTFNKGIASTERMTTKFSEALVKSTIKTT